MLHTVLDPGGTTQTTTGTELELVFEGGGGQHTCKGDVRRDWRFCSAGAVREGLLVEVTAPA